MQRQLLFVHAGGIKRLYPRSYLPSFTTNAIRISTTTTTRKCSLGRNNQQQKMNNSSQQHFFSTTTTTTRIQEEATTTSTSTTTTTTMIPYQNELEYCMDIAYEAGVIAMEFCNNRSLETAASILGVEQKIDDSPVTLVDKKLDAFIKEALEKRFPDCLVVGEESSMSIASTQKLEEGKVFYVDPIDGTKEFISNNGEWCVMIGLNVDGVPVMGVVYVASRDHMYYAVKGHGSFIVEGNLANKSTNRQAVSKRLQANSFTDPKQMSCLRSRSHDEREITDVMVELGVEKAFPSGSFGIKCGLLAQGTADLYINASKKTHYWDTSAPGIIASEAGCVLLDIDGNELQYTGVATNTVHEVVMFATIKPMKEQVMAAVQKIYAHRR